MNISGESDYRGFIEVFVPRIHSVDDMYDLFRGLGYPPEAILDHTCISKRYRVKSLVV